MAETKKNFLWNLTLTMANYIFPLLTYPYITRVLGVSKIGLCNYVDSIINYFVLFASLGITSLGIREVAKTKNDETSLSIVFSSLISFNVILTIISIIILTILTYSINFFNPYKPFLLIGILKLLFSAFLIEWLFQGLSDFRYITIRSIIVRVIYIISIFLFVHSPNDTLIYYGLTCGIIVANSYLNCRYSRKFVTFSIKNIHLKLFISAIISYGIYRILTSMYTSFNIIFLGSVSNDTEVGFFTTATKLYSILMGVFSAFTAVMIPKVSELLACNDVKKLKDIAEQTFNLVYSLSIPIIIICYFYSKLIINIIAGNGYEGAIIPFKIVMSLLIVVALEQIIIQQFLMANKKTKNILILSLTGAIIGVVLNIFLTPTFKAIGSSISWVFSEFSILLLSIIYFRKQYGFPLYFNNLIKHIISYIPLILICLFLSDSVLSFKSIAGLILAFTYFLFCNIYIMKNKIFIQLISRLHLFTLKR